MAEGLQNPENQKGVIDRAREKYRKLLDIFHIESSLRLPSLRLEELNLGSVTQLDSDDDLEELLAGLESLSKRALVDDEEIFALLAEYFERGIIPGFVYDPENDSVEIWFENERQGLIKEYYKLFLEAQIEASKREE